MLFKNKQDKAAWGSQVALVVKNPPVNAGDIRDLGSVPGSGRSPGGGRCIQALSGHSTGTCAEVREWHVHSLISPVCIKAWG